MYREIGQPLKSGRLLLLLLLIKLAFAPATAQHPDAGESIAAYSAAPSLAVLQREDGERRVTGKPTNDTEVADHLFEIGSITKLFTGLLLAELIEDGMVSEDTTIAELMPQGRVLDTEVGSITLLELATHSSGLPRLPTQGPMLRRLLLQMGDPYAGSTREEILDAVAALSSDELENRGRMQYSNLGMALLGQLLAEAAGQPYEQLIEERLLQPLGMKDTRFTRDALGDPRLQRPHRENGLAASNWRLDAYNPTGGLVSSLADMERFLDAVIAAEHPAMQRSLSVALRNEDGEPVMGLGWIIRERNGETVYWHNGRTGGYSSFLAWMPESERGLIMLANASHSMDPAAWALLEGEQALPHPDVSLLWQGFFLVMLALAPITLFGRRVELRETLKGTAKHPKGWLNGIGSGMSAAFILGVVWLNAPWQLWPMALFWLSAVLCLALAAAMLPLLRQLPALPREGRAMNSLGFAFDVILLLALVVMLALW
ncbi:serine hydrolase domain-containing protein [Natronospira bacteriovora]|uniref:Serine hydrolase domain-containing protein n=1 Tax=Natronospira bacteriovora TaxID=3069753 RepID=A0ABU0W7T6_9GAMM|nr:serine hydrolase domain-containing protein [Natronospira sp. AB-CW4]MDQ2070087.1 serine hydrolase domain-containing protein [Natronospira sp. AB-CW4]